MFEKLKRDIRNLCAKAIITLVNDAANTQELQVNVLDGETHDTIQRLQNYGFTSVPLPGQECLVIFPGGSRSHGIALGADGSERIKGLLPGDTAIYTASGNSVILKENGDITMQCNTIGGKIRMEGDVVEIHAKAILKYDCLGTGFRIEPGFIHSYTTGAAGDAHPINPPEVPITG
jgi:phage baseplate assembly protein V